MFRPSCRNPFSSEPVDAAQDVSEQVSRDCDLGHLEGYIAPVANDLDQAVPKRRHRPLLHGIRQRQSAQEVAEIVGKCVKLEADSIVGEPATGYRLGAAIGVNLPGMRMAGRDEADVNYERAVIPALGAIAEDQRGYLDIKDTNLESEHEEVLKFVSTIAGQRLALEASVREYERERKDAAVSMQPADIKRLDADEFKTRLSLLPQKQREAEIEALKEK
jgi:hypothetical protein